VLRGAKLSVVKKRRRKEVSEEMSIHVPIITRKFRMYFIGCVVNCGVFVHTAVISD